MKLPWKRDEDEAEEVEEEGGGAEDGSEEIEYDDTTLFPFWEKVLRAGYVVVALGALGALYYYVVRPMMQKTPDEIAAARLAKPERVAGDSGLVVDPIFSPDGQYFAYSSDRGGALSIYVERSGAGRPVRLTTDDGNESESDFSPDGKRVAFRAERGNSGIFVAPFDGDKPAASKLLVKHGRHPRFSPDGKWIVYFDTGFSMDRVPRSGRSYLIPADGGEPKPVLPEFETVQAPIWIDATHLLFSGISSRTERDWWVYKIDGGDPVRVNALPKLSKTLSVWSAPERWKNGRVYFSGSTGGDLHVWELELDKETWAAGDPVRLTIGPDRRSQPAISADNRLAYTNARSDVAIFSVPLAGNEGKVQGEMKEVIGGQFVHRLPSVSPDGQRLVYVSNRSGNQDLWLGGFDGDPGIALTSFRQIGYRPIISVDGKSAVYSTLLDQKCTVAVINLESKQIQKRLEGCAGIWDWAPDGKSVLFFHPRPDSMQATGLLDLATNRRTEILAQPGMRVFHSRFSPDGRWIAFTVGTSFGEAKLAVAPFRGGPIKPNEWIMISEENGTAPAWSPDGNLVYYRSRRDGFDCIWVQPLNAAKKPSAAAFPAVHLHKAGQSLFRLPEADFEMTVTKDRLVLPIAKHSGQVWVGKIKK